MPDPPPHLKLCSTWVPDTEHLISEALQIVTNSFYLMALQRLQLYVGERLPLTAWMWLQGHCLLVS